MCLTAWGFPLLVPCIPSQPGSVLTRASASLLCSWPNWHRTSASQGHTLCYQRWNWSSLKRGQKTVRWFTSSKERYQKNRVVGFMLTLTTCPWWLPSTQSVIQMFIFILCQLQSLFFDWKYFSLGLKDWFVYTCILNSKLPVSEIPKLTSYKKKIVEFKSFTYMRIKQFYLFC